MVMSRTSAVEASIQAVSPELIIGGGVASAGACARAVPPVARSAANAGKSEKRVIRYFILTSPDGSVDRKSAAQCMSVIPSVASERVGVGLAGADADGVLDGDDEDLAGADLTGAGRRGDRVDHLVDLPAGHRT